MSTPTQVHSRLGRPKDITKRDAIIRAAKELFASRGFAAVTMDAVAVQAGVSKMTVYSHFIDKETLFEKVVISISDQMIAALAKSAEGGRDLRDRLVAMGCAFLRAVLEPVVTRMFHSMPGILRGNPALARRFYDAGPGRTRAALVIIIEEHAERGELRVDRAEWVADDLLCLWDAGAPAKIAFAIDEHLTPAEMERRVVRAVDVFLRAYSTAPAKDGGSAGPAAPRHRSR